MNSENSRRSDDWPPVMFIKNVWPVILAFVSIVAMYTTLSNRVGVLEQVSSSRSPIVSSHENRIITLETRLGYMERQLGIIDDKVDKIWQKVK